MNKETPLTPYSHFSFCPACGWEYKTWKTKVEFRCFKCNAFIILEKEKSYPEEVKEEPSCRWFR